MVEKAFGEGSQQIKFRQFSDGEIEVTKGRRKVSLIRAKKGNDNYEGLFERALNAYFEFLERGSKANATFTEDAESSVVKAFERPAEIFHGTSIPLIRSSKPLMEQPRLPDRRLVEDTLRKCEAVAVLRITEEGWFGGSAFLFTAKSLESADRMDHDIKRLMVQYTETAGWIDIARAS